MKPRQTIGILTDRIRYKKDLFDKLTTSAFTAYLEACNEIGASVFAFGLNNIDLDHKRVYGYTPSIDNPGHIIWNEGWLPIPDFIVNRAYMSVYSVKNETLNKLTNSFPKVKIINRITRISKWTMYKTLRSDNTVKDYLPKTVLYDGIDSINEMLKEFSCVYFKPANGSLGIGVVKITKINENQFQAEYRKKKRNYSSSGSLSDILLQLEPLMGKWIYIVQEGIPLAMYRGNIFDFRVCVQKDGTGKWCIPAWIVRAAKPSNVITNNAAGAGSFDVERVISTIFPSNATEVLDAIKNTSILISEAIERNFPDIADIGMDLAITNTGKIYFIEANLRQNKFMTGSAKEFAEWGITCKVPIYYLNYLYHLEDYPSNS